MAGTLKSKRFWLWFSIIFIFVILNASVIIFYQPLSNLVKNIFKPQASWYAVHLTNGHVYFGKIKSVNPTTIELTSAYYLEAYTTQPNQAQGENVQLQSVPQTTYNLIKRGSDTFLTTNHVFFINRAVVLFWEKLTPDAGIVGWIEKAESGK